MTTLWHYTCDHAHPTIRRSGVLVPNRYADPALVWLTDLKVPQRAALGLTSYMLLCDRTVHRYRVLDDSNVVPWHQVRRAYPHAALVLEQAEGARPSHWWVSGVDVPVVYDPVRKGVAFDA